MIYEENKKYFLGDSNDGIISLNFIVSLNEIVEINKFFNWQSLRSISTSRNCVLLCILCLKNDFSLCSYV